MLKKITLTATLALALAAPAQAQAPEIARDMGAGLLIAAQGNQALHRIKAELKEAIKTWAPALPPAPRPVQVVGASAAAAAVRCAP